MITRLYPTTQGNYDVWTLGAGTSKMVALQSDDADTSYIVSASGVSERESYVHQNLPSYALVVSTHILSSKSKSTTGGGGGLWPQTNGFLRRSAADTDGANATLEAAYVLNSDTDLIQAGPTPAQVNATEIGIRITSAANGNAYCTWMYWDVTHTISLGVFVFPLFQWLGPLVCVGLHEMPRVARALWARSGHLIEPHEYRQAWQDLRDYRSPKYHLLRA